MTKQKYYLHLLCVLSVCYFVISLFSACTTPGDRKKIDVSKIPARVHAIRFDQELYACDTNHLAETVNRLGDKYPDFASVYFKDLTGFARNGNNEQFLASVKHFLTYKDYRGLYDTVQKKFPDVSDINHELEMLFKHIRYYFPKEKTGDVYYFISGLNNWSAVTVDTALGIGLDMYLGTNYPFYPSVELPAYEIQRCEKKYIPINAARVLYENMYPYNPDGKNLLELMLLKGRQLVFMEYVLPEAGDDLLMGYTPAQLKWCTENEAMIWNYFSAQKLLYSTNWQDMIRYVNDGPTSTGMPPESPGNIGSWIGWQIVRTYMKAHPEKSMTDIVSGPLDVQAFLRDAAYSTAVSSSAWIRDSFSYP